MLRILHALVAVALVAIGVSGCSGSPGTEGDVIGIVTDVTGDLTEIKSFVVLDTSGDSHKFTPGDGMTVMGSPASHLRDHVVSGEPVRVIHHKGPNGRLIADDVTHAGD
jgi:hypothetical protein